ncbi:hypothetical protein GSB9_02848 [Flavobacteriaceae bacterium GSB9]|nr:hypothetical protein GSB9_02848 [Flavobacteriaceae bacterium GSB9]
MSFGVVQSAISSIKNNRSLLSKKDKFKNMLSAKNANKLEFKTANASSYELKKLRDRLRKENRRIKLKRNIFVGSVMLVLIVLFLYFI